MLLDITPAGNEFQRRMLLDYTSKLRLYFLASLVLMPLAIYIGCACFDNKKASDEEYFKNVAMVVVDQGGDRVSQGTAFLLAKPNGEPTGYMFTARHVIANSDKENVALMFPYIKDKDGEPLITNGKIVWTTNIPFDGSKSGTLAFDVALLKLSDISVLPDDVAGFTVATNMNVKDPIAIYGFPQAEGFYNNGVISNVEYDGVNSLMVMSFALDHGLSGAPVYNEETGEVLGIAIAGNGNLGNIALKLQRVLQLMESDKINIFK